jgi:hypothetical protein
VASVPCPCHATRRRALFRQALRACRQEQRRLTAIGWAVTLTRRDRAVRLDQDLAQTHHRRDRGAVTATMHNQDRSRSAPTGCPATPAPLPTWPVVSLDSVAPERAGQGTTFAATTGEIATASLDQFSSMQHGRSSRRRSLPGSSRRGCHAPATPLSSGVVPAGTAGIS